MTVLSSACIYPPLKSSLRTLEVLTVLNRSGTIPLRELHRATGIPKPTLIRTLETLIAAGLAQRDPAPGCYSVTPKITMLSTGLQGTPLVVERSVPHAEALSKKLRWPVSVATLDVDAMVVRFSTIPKSSLGSVHSAFDKRLPLIDRAAGIAYLAFCPEAERRRLLSMIRATDPRARGKVGDRIKHTCAAGFAAEISSANPPTVTVAVPLMFGNHVVATLGVTYLSRMLSLHAVADEMVPPIRATALVIQGELASASALP